MKQIRGIRQVQGHWVIFESIKTGEWNHFYHLDRAFLTYLQIACLMETEVCINLIPSIIDCISKSPNTEIFPYRQKLSFCFILLFEKRKLLQWIRILNASFNTYNKHSETSGIQVIHIHTHTFLEPFVKISRILCFITSD